MIEKSMDGLSMKDDEKNNSSRDKEINELKK